MTSPALDIILEPIIVIGDPECDPYLDANWCEDPGSGWGECLEGEVYEQPDPEAVGIEGECGNGGGESPGLGGSGSTPSEPPTSQPADTCRTGNPVIDSPEVQAALDSAWQASNFGSDIPHSERLEQGGWVVRTAAGYDVIPFPEDWIRTPCTILFPPEVVPPPGLVGWFHTHPYTNGEVLNECERMTLPNRTQFPYTYRNDPSDNDDEITRTLRSNGFPDATGYMIDADRITWFTGDDSADTVGTYSRCGY